MTRKKISRADAALYLERDPYREVVARLEPKTLRTLVREAPKPIARYEALGAAIDVFCAKRLYHPTWINPALFRLTIDARGSYYRYGDYPALDALDRKAAVYLARVRYAEGRGVGRVLMEEWLSVRFIPWRGTPYGYDDLKLCAYKGKTIDHWVQKKFPRREGIHALVSVSRVCGISPYPARAGDDKNEPRRASHAHTARAFAAMNNEFFNVARHDDSEFRHVTTLMHRALVERSLTVGEGKKRATFKFTPAHRALGLSAPVKLARDGFAASYCRRFPQYFLDVEKLVVVLRNAVRMNVVSRATLAHFLGDAIAPEEMLRDDGLPAGRHGVHIARLRGLGVLLSSEGVLPGATITGDELRRMVRDVPDGPALHMMNVNEWQKSVAEFCRIVKLTRRAP